MAVEVDILSQVPLFSELEREELERLAGQFREHTFPQGAVVTREGERGPRVLAFFVIAEGRASVSVGEDTKAVLGPGDHFGEIGLFHDQPRTARVTAVSDLRVYAHGRVGLPAVRGGEPRRLRGRSWRAWRSASPTTPRARPR